MMTSLMAICSDRSKAANKREMTEMASTEWNVARIFGSVALVMLGMCLSTRGDYINRIGVTWTGTVNAGPNRLIDSPWGSYPHGQDGASHMFSNLPNSGTNPVDTVVYDMAGTANLASLTVYTNGAGNSTRKIEDIQVAVGDSQTGPWTVLTTGSSSSLTLNEGAVGEYPDTTFNFDSYTGDHRYVRLGIISDYSDSDSRGGFRAIEFDGTYATQDTWPPVTPDTVGQVSASVVDSSQTDVHKGPVSEIVDGITDAQTGWLGNGNTGFVTLDLGAPQPVTGLRVFRYNQGGSISFTARAARLITISSGDSATGPWTPMVTDWLQPFYPTDAPTNYIIPQDVALSVTAPVRFLRLDLTGWNTGYIGLNEVQVFAPEPASAVILGMAAIALARRRSSRRRLPDEEK